jgi:hypothetical protein
MERAPFHFLINSCLVKFVCPSQFCSFFRIFLVKADAITARYLYLIVCDKVKTCEKREYIAGKWSDRIFSLVALQAWLRARCVGIAQLIVG